MSGLTRSLPIIKRIGLLLFIGFACLPLVQMTMISFVTTLPKSGVDVGSLTFGNYAGIWADPNLRAAFGNSIAYVLINICITVPVAIPAAYAFSRMSFLGDKWKGIGVQRFGGLMVRVIEMPLRQNLTS